MGAGKKRGRAPKGADARSGWVGRCVGRRGGERYYTAFLLDGAGGDGDEAERVSVGDFVAVTMTSKDKLTGSSTSHAEVIHAFEAADGTRMAEVRWLYAGHETSLTAGDLRSVSDHEIFETDHVQDIDVAAILRPVRVLDEPGFARAVAEGGAADGSTFFCRRFFSARRAAFLKMGALAAHRTRSLLYSRRTLQDEAWGEGGRREAVGRVRTSADLARGDSRGEGGDPPPANPAAAGAEASDISDEPADLFSLAARALNLSAVPASLPCRDEERAQIDAFLRNTLREGGTGNAMYISGMPGTGKTATVREVVSKLAQEYHRSQEGGPAAAARADLRPFRFVEVNGMKLPHPHAVYTELWEAISGVVLTPKAAAVELELFFGREEADRTCTVLLVDELDFMVTAKQTVLYNLFEWPTRPASRLTVVGIANTMDLPERLLPRVSSRLGGSRIVFRPYAREQVREILMARLRGLELFEGDALEMAARKVASVSGDMRRALQICRRAVEICHARPADDKTAPRVGIPDIQRASRELTSAPHLRAVAKAAPAEVLLLVCLGAHVRATAREDCTIEELSRRMDAAATAAALDRAAGAAEVPKVPPAHLKEMIRRLTESRVLLARVQDGEVEPVLRLNMEVMDVAQGLRDSYLAKKHLPIFA